MFEDQKKQQHINKLAIFGLNTVGIWSLRLMCIGGFDQGFI